MTDNELDKLADSINPNNPHGDNYEQGQYFGFQDGFKAGVEYQKKISEKYIKNSLDLILNK